MADSSDVDAAIVTRLSGDAILASYMPDGVFFDVAAKGTTRFVIVSQVSHEDENEMLGGPAWEVFTYLVKAVSLSNSGADVKLASARIYALLQDGPLSPDGYGLMLARRTERVRYTEVDDLNKDIRWQHRGGHYEIWVQPTQSTWVQGSLTPPSEWIQAGWAQ